MSADNLLGRRQHEMRDQMIHGLSGFIKSKENLGFLTAFLATEALEEAGLLATLEQAGIVPATLPISQKQPTLSSSVNLRPRFVTLRHIIYGVEAASIFGKGRLFRGIKLPEKLTSASLSAHYNNPNTNMAFEVNLLTLGLVPELEEIGFLPSSEVNAKRYQVVRDFRIGALLGCHAEGISFK
jgi:hypothetical protein